MELKDQVCSHEQAMQLRKLGIHQAGQFWSHEFLEKNDNTIFVSTNPNRMGPFKDWAVHHSLTEPYKNNEIVSRFTASELGELLPTQSGIICWDVSYNDHHGQWECRIYDLVKWIEQDQKTVIPPVAYESEGDTMAYAMADALIHCMENKLINPSQSTNQ